MTQMQLAESNGFSRVGNHLGKKQIDDNWVIYSGPRDMIEAKVIFLKKAGIKVKVKLPKIPKIERPRKTLLDF